MWLQMASDGGGNQAMEWKIIFVWIGSNKKN